MKEAWEKGTMLDLMYPKAAAAEREKAASESPGISDRPIGRAQDESSASLEKSADEPMSKGSGFRFLDVEAGVIVENADPEYLRGRNKAIFDAGAPDTQSAEPAKPLHVQVAEALGCKPEDGHCHCLPHSVRGRYWPHGEDGNSGYPASPILRYDTDWSATGPLIERYGITLKHAPCIRHAGCEDLKWDASAFGLAEAGHIALLAVCDLLIALGKAGKL